MKYTWALKVGKENGFNPSPIRSVFMHLGLRHANITGSSPVSTHYF